MKKIEAVCEYCKKKYLVREWFFRRAKKHFCSYKCHWISNIIKIKVKCANCNKEIEKAPCRIRANNFCSNQCCADFNNRKTKVKCGTCDREFEKKQSQISEKNFCSHKCYTNSRRNKIKTKCKICNKEFEIPLNRINTGKFCSISCSSIFRIGENHPNWKGGIARLPYPFDFNEELKELIRKRDNYKCRLCGCPQEECLIKLPIHHIDYDKNNSDPKNLISLCIKCHSKSNYNRVYYQKQFEIKQQEQEIYVGNFRS